MFKVSNTQSEIYIGNTIEFDKKSSQVEVNILKRTKKRLKELTVNRLQKNRWHGQRVCDAMTQTYVKSDHYTAPRTWDRSSQT